MDQYKSLFNLNILLVEDDPETLYALQATLSDQPYFLKCAGNVFEAIHEIKETDASHYFDLVLVDVLNPREEGANLIEVIRKNCPLAKIIAYTHLESGMSREKYRQLGFDSVVAKGKGAVFLRTIILDTCQKIIREYNDHLEKKISDPYKSKSTNQYLRSIREQDSLTRIRIPSTLSDLSVLFVDDDREIIKALQHLTLQEQYKSEFSENGVLAIKKIEETQTFFDVVFLDIHMPFMDGYETIHVVSQLLKGTRIIAHTDDGGPGKREHYLQQGFYDYLPKELSMEELKKQIHAICLRVILENEPNRETDSLKIPNIPRDQSTYPAAPPVNLKKIEVNTESGDSYQEMLNFVVAYRQERQELLAEIKRLETRLSKVSSHNQRKLSI